MSNDQIQRSSLGPFSGLHLVVNFNANLGTAPQRILPVDVTPFGVARKNAVFRTYILNVNASGFLAYGFTTVDEATGVAPTPTMTADLLATGGVLLAPANTPTLFNWRADKALWIVAASAGQSAHSASFLDY